MAEQADQVTGRTRAKPIILYIPNAKRIEQTKRIEDVRLPLTEMIAVIMPLQQLAHLLGAHPHLVRHSIHLVMKRPLQFRLRDTADRLIGRTHTDILWLVETAEHTHLRKLRHAREQHEAQVLVSSLEGRVETLESITIEFLNPQVVAIAIRRPIVRVEHIQQRFVILIDEHHTLLASTLMNKSPQPGKTLPHAEAIVTRHSVLPLPVLNTHIQFVLQRAALGEVAAIEVDMKNRILLPLLLQVLDGQTSKQLPLPTEIILQRRDEQALAKPTRTAQKVNLTLRHHLVQQGRLVHIDKTAVNNTLKILYADGILHSQTLLVCKDSANRRQYKKNVILFYC